MNHQRNLVVTEAGLALSLLTCLLLVLGYMILSRLNESGQASTEDVHSGYAVQPANAVDEAPLHAAEQPQVLTIERSDSPAPVVHTSARPDGAAVGADDDDAIGSAEPPLQPRDSATLR